MCLDLGGCQSESNQERSCYLQHSFIVGRQAKPYASEIQILQRIEMMPNFGYRSCQFLSKAVNSGGTFSPWETGNLDPNISDISKLYFLMIIKGKREHFLVIHILGMVLSALTYINSFKIHSLQWNSGHFINSWKLTYLLIFCLP